MMPDDAEAALASHSKSLASNSAGLRISASEQGSARYSLQAKSGLLPLFLQPAS